MQLDRRNREMNEQEKREKGENSKQEGRGLGKVCLNWVEIIICWNVD